MSTAYNNGHAAGIARASWADIPDERAAYVLVTGIDDGDPEVLDTYDPGAPLSGEWAGESMTELLGDDYTDDDADDYERGFSEGYWHELERTARAIVTEG